MPITSTSQINTLGANTTFYDWYTKENDEIIKSLNELIQFNDSIQNAKF